MSTRRVTAWLAAWVTMLVLGSFAVQQHLRLDSDLRLFLPTASTPAERILLQQLKDGPGTRLLLIALGDASAEHLAGVSAELAQTLRSNTAFTRVDNGTWHADAAVQDLITRYRYLLTPAPSQFTPQELHDSLQDRLQDLTSPLGGLTQDNLLRDPTGELPKLLEAWQAGPQPRLLNGVWFDRAGTRALLIAQTRAPGFDAAAQQVALAALHDALRTADPSHQTRMDITGPGAFTAVMEKNVRSDVTHIGLAEGVASFCFLFVVLWSLRHVLISSLTLATAGLVALAGVTLLFDQVHGITLAFGFTLLGVAMDYPVHLLLHLQPTQRVQHTLHHVWPTLRLSIATTCIAYASLALAGFTGLAQLGVFTVCGLLATGVLIRYLLPHLADVSAARRIPAWVRHSHHWPRWRALPYVLLCVSVVALAFSPHPLWNNELSGLTPVPQALQARDEALRRELSAPDLRYLLAIRAADVQHALQRDEALAATLDEWQRNGVIGGADHPSLWLPSMAQQQTRQTALPDEATLQHAMQQAQASLPFQHDAFRDFFTEVHDSKQLKPLDLQDLANTALADRLGAMLFHTEAEAVALITLHNVTDASRLAALVQPMPDVLLLDLKVETESLVARFRHRALWALGGALLMIAAVMLVQLSWREALAVLVPVLATLTTEVALLNWLGVSLTLFHIVSLLLVGGLCFDYGLFFNRSEASSEDALRTRYAVMACWLSTTGSFALLMISSLPVLFAIGSTVAAGVTLGFFTALLARHARH